jgi:hypothetical protein
VPAPTGSVQITTTVKMNTGDYLGRLGTGGGCLPAPAPLQRMPREGDAPPRAAKRPARGESMMRFS